MVSVLVGTVLLFGSVFGLPALCQWRLDVADKKAAEKPVLPQDFRAMLDKDAELKTWWEAQQALCSPDAESDLDIKVKEVRNAIKAQEDTEELQPEDMSGVREDLSAQRTTEPEVRGVPDWGWFPLYDELCSCSPEHIVDGAGKLRRIIHGADCRTRVG